MAGKDIIIMSRKEFTRTPVMYSVINKQITLYDAANILGLSRRQINRLVKKLVQAVKRNIYRFPEDFMFQLTWEESVL